MDQNFKVQGQANAETDLADAHPLTSESVYEAARRNDVVAKDIVQITSAYLARAIHWLIMTYDVEKVVLGVTELSRRAADYDLIIIGTINADVHDGQANLVNALLMTDTPVVVAALRTPYDLMVFPDAPTYLCTYSILEPSMQALAAALWGEIPLQGRLPVKLDELGRG